MIRPLISGLVAASLLASCSAQEERGPVVLAAASLTQVLEDAADAWERQGHLRPQLSFAGTPSIARQVAEGAPADIVISADEQWMDWLAKRNLIKSDTRRDIASNSLAFVWRETRLSLPGDSTYPDVPNAPRKIAMADPDTVPAGRYARQALEYAGVWGHVADRIVPTDNVRLALALVERGEVDLGIVYTSDAQVSPNLFSAPLDVPERVAVLYPGAQLRSSGNEEAVGFLDFLSGPGGEAVLCEYGFTLPPGHEPC